MLYLTAAALLGGGMPGQRPVRPASAAAMRPEDRALYEAAGEGDLERAEELLGRGADPSCLHTNDYSVLMHAVSAWKTTPERRLAMARLLLAHGANPHYIAGDGHQALTFAFELEVVEHLLDLGVALPPETASRLMYKFNGSRSVRALLAARGVEAEWQDTLRQAYRRIRDYEGQALYAEVLEEAVPLVRGSLRGLERYRRYDPQAPIDLDDQYECYALGRINELLLLRFQAPPGGTPDAGLTPEEYRRFWSAVGMEVWEPRELHPFHCELYRVEERPEAQSPTLLHCRWPCLLFGELLFSRASVAVAAAPRHLHKQSAEESTLYWCHQRLDRPYDDLSLDWGSNSQWRTCFRFDYWSGEELFYNVNHDEDEDDDPDDEESLSEAQRLELLRHRCFVTMPEVRDCFPYDYFAAERYKPKEAALRRLGD